MFRNKRGQFFLLAALIISAVTLSFGTITNNAIVNVGPDDLRDYSYDVKREAGNVIDYEIYKNFAANTHLPDFIDLLAKEVREKDSDVNFMFIYGNSDSLTVRNYGSEGTKTCTGGNCQYTAGGSKRIKSTIRYGSSSKKVDGSYDKRKDNWAYTQTNLPAKSNVTVTVQDKDFIFDVGKERQVVFIMQKEDKDESFIYVR